MRSPETLAQELLLCWNPSPEDVFLCFFPLFLQVGPSPSSVQRRKGPELLVCPQDPTKSRLGKLVDGFMWLPELPSNSESPKFARTDVPMRGQTNDGGLARTAGRRAWPSGPNWANSMGGRRQNEQVAGGLVWLMLSSA